MLPYLTYLTYCVMDMAVEGPSGLVKTELMLLMLVYFNNYNDHYNSRTIQILIERIGQTKKCPTSPI